MVGKGHDTAYLKDTVGEALARGCSAAIQAQPNDPVEFLGLWLLKYAGGRQCMRMCVCERVSACCGFPSAAEVQLATAPQVRQECRSGGQLL